MTCWYWPLLLVTNIHVINLASAIGTYTAVAPSVLRPGLAYHVSISVHDTPQPVKITATIGGSGVRGNSHALSNEALLNPGETQILKFDIGDWGPGKYNLTIGGSGGLSFVNSTEVTFEQKSYSVFIQTDKAIYKPGELVHFRCIVVNPMLRPSVSSEIEVFILDGKNNRVKQFKRVFTTKGVFTGKILLSDQPVLGDWNVTVKVVNQVFSKSFAVAEYVLPTYDVKLRLPPYALFNDTTVLATVTATYTYGKPVKGELTLMLSPRVHSPIIQVWFTPPVRKTVPIDGTADVQLNLGALKLQEDFQRDIKVEAVVTEDLTGRRYNTSSILSLYRHKVKLELVQMAENFKPGLKFTCFLKVAYQDDIPVQDSVNPVTVRFGYNYNDVSYQVSRYRIPRNGLIRLDFYPPHTPNTNVLVIVAEYADVKQYFPGIEPALSPSNNYIQAVLLSDTPRVSDEVEIEVNATEQMKSFVYQVVGRGDISIAQTIHVNDERTVRFKLLVTAPMAPRARLLVHYVRLDGEVVADSIQFDVEGVFQTPVSLSLSTNQTLPGKQINVQVNTRPNAFVGILGVDQSVLLLKTGNDITRNDVIKELETYDTGKKSPDFSDLYLRYLWSPGAITASKVFEESGVVIITNGNVFQYYPRILYRSHVAFEDDLTAVADNSLQHKQSISLNSEEPQLRSHFPETWLWEGHSAGPDGSVVVSSSAPDTITSWIVSAFAVDPISGLGVAPSTAKLTVFRPFFLSINLPYSIVRGEAVGIQVVVFNYMTRDVDATVTLKGSDKFSFIAFESQTNEIYSGGSHRQKRVKVRASDGTSLTFMIVPRVLGYIDIEVSAQADDAGDRVLKKLLVKPEGLPVNFNKALLVDLRQKTKFSSNVSIDIPYYAVSDSQYIEVSTIADVLGPAINNLDKLLQMPFGCGEQNMLNFVPNIVVAEYLSQAGLLTDDIKAKIVHHLETGYQRELTYKRSDGSFSAFGETDKSGSTWLTAFVAKSLQQAKPHISVDDAVITKSLRWLASHQSSDGSFPEVGSVSHKAMQGGAANGLALTAYVMIALLENDAKNSQELSKAVQKGLQRLQESVVTLEDVYPLAITTYALHLAESPAKEQAFSRLSRKANVTGETRFWMDDNNDLDTSTVTSAQQARSIDIEMTSYALMTYIIRGDYEGAIAIMKWLVSQINSNGGFASTQDTVIGIQALASLAKRIIIPNSSVDVQFTFNENTKSVTLNADNRMILHKLQLPSNVRNVTVNALGSGFAIVQVSYSYNLNVTSEKPAFQVKPLVDRNSNRNLLVINSCTSYLLPGTSNMAVMEVRLPSGYTVDQESLPAMMKDKNVKRVETLDGNSMVAIYFDKLDGNEVCPTVKAYRTFKVAKQKPTAVKVYDYYDNARSARSFYQAIPATLCDICEGSDCDQRACKTGSLTQDPEEPDGASTTTNAAVMTITMTVLSLLITRFLMAVSR